MDGEIQSWKRMVSVQGACSALTGGANVGHLPYMVDLTKRWPFGITRQNWLLFATVLLVLVVSLLRYDHQLSAAAHAQSPQVLDFFNQITRWGESDWLLIPSAALLAVSALGAWLIRPLRIKLAMIEMAGIFGFIFVGIGLPSLVSNLLKRLIGRGRPGVFDSVGNLSFHPFAGDFFFESFPSGHTTTAFAAAMVLGFLAPRWLLLGIVYAVAILTSRVVLGVHYPTDVLCGAVLGSLGAYAVRNFFAQRGWAFREQHNGRIVLKPLLATRRLLRPFQRRAAT